MNSDQQNTFCCGYSDRCADLRSQSNRSSQTAVYTLCRNGESVASWTYSTNQQSQPVLRYALKYIFLN